jgi:TRAP-type C4-dicarboxylate transport system substrate-binding protein
MRLVSRGLRTTILLLVCLGVLSPCPATAAAQNFILKFATLAPAGSAWMQLLEAWAEEVRVKSEGRLVFKIYPGGVQGDEPDVIKKIRFGQLQGGAFTGYGIGHIYSPARALELPFLFNNIDEIDYVRSRFMPTIEQGFRDNGYELLGWMEVGLIYFFSREPIYSIDDLKKRRIWQWTGDPMGQAFFDASGIAPVPLSIIDVYTSLSTGLIDTVYCPPLGAIALQWFTKTHYITNVPMANGIGALVVSSRFFQSLPQDLQKLLKSTGQKTGEQLIEVTRRDNRESLEILRSKGMEFILNPEDLDAGEVAEISKKAGESLTRSGYIPASTIHDINAWLADFRAQSHDHAPGNAVP